MGASCSIDAHVKNKEGAVVVSNLWKDLMEFTNNNRDLSKRYYRLGTNSAFLNAMGNKAKFDENGQITFASLKKLANLKVKEDEILKKIRNNFKTSKLTFEEAVDSVNSFNKNSQFKNKYMATIVEEKNGTYTVDIVPKNKANKIVLKNFLKNKALRDYLVKQLESLNCNVEWVKGVTYRGVFDTTQIEKQYNNTYTLIKIAKDMPIDLQVKVLSSEIGHFAINVLGDNDTMVQRLSNYLKPDIVNAYIAKHEQNSYLGAAKKREIMGHMVGEALYNRLSEDEKSTTLGRLLTQVKNRILSKFSKYKDEAKIMLVLSNAEKAIDDIVDGFINGDMNYDIAKALESGRRLISERLYSSQQNEIYQKLRQVASERQRMVDLIKRSDKKTAKKLQLKVDALFDAIRDHDSQSLEDLHFLHNALMLAYSDIQIDLFDAQSSLMELEKLNDLAIKQTMMPRSQELYEAGIRVSINTKCASIINNILSSSEFKRLRLSSNDNMNTTRTKEDLFYGTEQNVELDDFDNSDSAFDKIESHNNLFVDEDGRIRRSSGYYEDNQGRRYVRFHRVSETDNNGNKLSSDKESAKKSLDEWLRKAERGTRTDAFLRVMFESKGKDFDRALNEANNAEVSLNEGMSPVLFDINDENDLKYLKAIQDYTKKLMKHWAKQGIKWKTTNLVVSTQINNLRIAGEMDLLLKYPDGHVEVWDFKTTNKSSRDHNSPQKNVNYETQLNFYARALRNQGFDARVGGIIQINPDFLDSDNFFQFHVKTRKSLESLMVRPFVGIDDETKASTIPFIDAIEQQAKAEQIGNTGTISTEDDFVDDDIDDSLKDATEAKVLNYVSQYYPHLYKTLLSWLDNAGADRNTPYKALYHLGILPSTNSEKNKFNRCGSNNPIERSKEVASQINRLSTDLMTMFSNLTKRFSCIWLQDIYGSDMIKVASKAIKYGFRDDMQEGDTLIEPKSERRKKRHKSHKKVFYVSADRYVSSKEVMSTLQRDLNYLEFLFHPIGRSIDIPSQAISKMIDTANTRADRATYAIAKQLFDLKKEYHIGRSERLELYERDDDGNLTGYFISDTHYGRYEKDLQEFKDNARARFKKYLEEKLDASYDEIDESIKALQWSTWYSKEWNRWHFGVRKVIKDANGNPIEYRNGHSVKLKDGTIIPNKNYVDENGKTKYENKAYNELSSDQVNFLNKVKEIKEQLDDLIGGTSVTQHLRAPQIEADKKLDYFFNKTPQGIFKKGYNWFISKHVHKSNSDIEFGNDLSDANNNDPYENPYIDPTTHVSEVPIYFVKMLKDKNLMSTDIVGSMIAYASMANGFSALNSISTTIELVSSQLMNRELATEGKRQSDIDRVANPIYKFSTLNIFNQNLDNLYNTRFARGLRAYLEMNLYSRREPVILKGNAVINKLADLLKTLTTFRFLGGNLHGASVNLATGINEIWKEACVDEDLSWTSAIEAHKEYLKYLPLVLLGLFKQVPTDKANAWFRYFNARGDNAFKDKHHSAIWREPFTLSSFIMSPYSAGDHYMQAMSYLISAIDLKVYKRGSDKAYKFYDIYRNDNGVLNLPQNEYFTSQEFANDFDELKAIYDRVMLEMSKNDDKDVDIIYDGYESDLLRKYDIEISTLKSGDVINKLELLFDKNVVNENFEIEYLRKCRSVNDRMHGIYNKANKTTMHSSMIGSMLLSLRGYLLGYIERDFSSNREDITLRRGNEGIYKTMLNYIRSSFVQSTREGLKSILYSTVGASLATIPIVSNSTSTLLSKIMNKDISYNAFMKNNTQLGDFQINNLKRLGAKLNLIVLVQFILAPLCLTLAQPDPDDPDDEEKKGWLLLYYVLKRSSYEQVAASIIMGLIVSGFNQEKFKTGWMQEINRNSSFMPVQTMSAIYWLEDIYYLLGMFASTEDPEDFLVKEDGESAKAFNERKQEWLKVNHYFWQSTHYQKNYNMEWERDEDGKILKDFEGNKIPVYKTQFSRALHGNQMEGDSKYWKRLISIIPFLKSYKIYQDPEKGLRNWQYGQQTRQ